MDRQEIEEAKKWWNEMEKDAQSKLINNMVLNLYKMCKYTKELTYEEIKNKINSEWEYKIEVLRVQNETLQQNGQNYYEKINDSVRQIDLKINELSLKITPSSNGKLGENYVESLLGKIPGSLLINTSQEKGGGDFIYQQNNMTVMIESKNWTNSSIKGNPKEFDNFKNKAMAEKEKGKIDFAMMVLHRVTDLKGRSILLETVETKMGNLFLIYVTNIFNNPERILYGIELGFLLLDQDKKNSFNFDKIYYEIDYYLKSIMSIEESIKARNKIIIDLQELSKKDIDNVKGMRTSIENMLKLGIQQSNTSSNNNSSTSIEDTEEGRKVVYQCHELIKAVNGDESSITVKALEEKLIENSIPSIWIRKLGGIKNIKRIAMAKYKSEI
jgi:hypothetical protein